MWAEIPLDFNSDMKNSYTKRYRETDDNRPHRWKDMNVETTIHKSVFDVTTCLI